MFESGSIFGKYRIDELLGSGSMGDVYKALDTVNNRVVALKLMNEEYAESREYQERFNHEARAAAMIDSPHVVRVLENGRHEKIQYIAMEYVSGEDLRSSFESLDYDSKLKISLQVGRGLAAAHEKGLVHQDLKPENIKISDKGNAKILDFGLAKDIKADTVDQYGDVEGTLYYISPEQLSAETITQSADLFSFGVILFELFTGRRPFEGHYSAAVVYSILHEDPELPSDVNSELPAWLDDIIIKLLSKRPENRFASIQKVIDQIEKYMSGEAQLDLIRKPKLRQTVTIIDLKNMSGDDSWEYFCVGFTNDLVNELSRRTDLIVSAQSSTKYSRNIKECFRRCRSDFLIVGSLMRWEGNLKLHLTIYGDDGDNMLSARNYEGETGDIFDILSKAVEDSASVMAEIVGTEKADTEDYFKTDIAAYDFYLKGKNYYQTNKPDDLEIAERMYKKALQIDPDLAYAHSGLSDLYAFQYMAYYDRSQEKIESARVEAETALEISPELPEAHRSLGRYYMFIGAYDSAEKAFLKAVEYNPKYAIGYRTIAWLKLMGGDPEKTVEWARLALKYAPNDLETLLLLGLANIHRGKNAIATATLRRAIDLAPDYGRAYYNLGKAYLKLGVLDIAIENFDLAVKYKGDPNAYIDAAYAHYLKGQYEEARSRFHQSIEADLFPFIANYYLGYLEKECGNSGTAAECFRKALEVTEQYEKKDPKNPHIKAYLSMTYAVNGQIDNARAVIEKMDDPGKYNGEVLYSIAKAYSLLEETEKVRDLIDIAITKHPGPTMMEVSLDPHFKDYGFIADRKQSA